MDGLSSQNEQEEEAMRAQVQEEQQQAVLLQQQIQRYSKQQDSVSVWVSISVIVVMHACMDSLACRL